MDEMIDKLHKQKDTPEYKDHCSHPKGSYLGSIQQGPKHNSEWLDIYVYEDALQGQSVCIRYGKNDSEYYSPGNVLNVIASIMTNPNMEAYQLATKVMITKGSIIFSRKAIPCRK